MAWELIILCTVLAIEQTTYVYIHVCYDEILFVILSVELIRMHGMNDVHMVAYVIINEMWSQ